MDEDRKRIDEKVTLVTNRAFDSQIKFTYYILAIDAACIGFAVTYNKDAHYSWFLTPFIAAIVCWLISFYYGLKELRHTDSILFLNVKVLEAQRDGKKALYDNATELFNKTNVEIVYFIKRKIWFLYVGTLAFVIWYLLRIYFKS